MTKSNTHNLEEYINYWFENDGELRLKPETLRTYRSVINNHIIPDLGQLKLNKATSDILQKFFTRKQKTCGMETIKLIRIILNIIFGYAVKKNQIKQNPLAQVAVK